MFLQTTIFVEFGQNRRTPVAFIGHLTECREWFFRWTSLLFQFGYFITCNESWRWISHTLKSSSSYSLKLKIDRILRVVDVVRPSNTRDYSIHRWLFLWKNSQLNVEHFSCVYLLRRERRREKDWHRNRWSFVREIISQVNKDIDSRARRSKSNRCFFSSVDEWISTSDWVPSIS